MAVDGSSLPATDVALILEAPTNQPVADHREFVNGRVTASVAISQHPHQETRLFVNGRRVQEVAAAALPQQQLREVEGADACRPARPWFEDIIGFTASGDKRRRLVLFDGMCRLCLGFVGLVVGRDPAGLFCFAPLQSDLGQEVLAWHGLERDLDSVVLHREGEAFIRSSAALEILGEVEGVMSALYSFIWLPRPLRDWGYELVAKSRFSLLGHTTISESADEAITARLLDTWEPNPDDPTHICSS